jgi:hypothetical protein
LGAEYATVNIHTEQSNQAEKAYPIEDPSERTVMQLEMQRNL